MKTSKNLFKIYNQVKIDLLKNQYYKLSDLRSVVNILKDKEKFLKRNFLKNQNIKLSSNVFSFDLPVGLTCQGLCKNCYAIKNERIMPTVRVSRLLNYVTILYALIDNKFNKFFINKIQSELNNIKLIYNKPVIRLHTSGDIFNVDYLNLWLKIINKNKRIKFYTYTKMAWLLPNVDNICKKYKNFNIVKSIISIDNKNYLNFGDKNYLNDLNQIAKENNIGIYLCKHHEHKHDSVKYCMGKCNKCLNCTNVVFLKH